MIMHKRSYTHVQVLLPEIRAMVSEGKTQREIAEHFGLSGKEVVRELLKRERRKEAKISAGIMPRPKGRPRKDATPRSIFAEQVYEINRLKMENELLRDFLQLTGRK
jgi:transposase